MEDIDIEIVGKFIENLRREKGMTQQQLAKMLSVTNQSVSKWEMGKNLPDIATQRNMCKIFEITLEELHAGEKDIKSRNISKQMKRENKIFSIIIILNAFPLILLLIKLLILSIYSTLSN